MSEAILATELDTEPIVEARLQRLIGSVVVKDTINTEPVSTSLYDTMRSIDHKDKESFQNFLSRIGAELSTSVLEILYLNGHVSEIVTDDDEATDAYAQFGYVLEEMYANGTMYNTDLLPAEWWRRLCETKNEVRVVVNRPMLEDGWALLEESLFPDDMDEETADEEFAYHSKSRKSFMRLHWLNEDGKRVFETAPVRGNSPNGRPHDQWAANNVYKHFGQEIEVGTTERIHRALWVKKEDLPNGVASAVEISDQVVNNGNAFFGVWNAKGDYSKIKEISVARERKIADELPQKVQEVLPLLKAATGDDDLLGILTGFAKDWAAELSVDDLSIDPEQFGPKSAHHIRAARTYLASGDYMAMQQAIWRAKAEAIVYVCGVRFMQEKKDGIAANSVSELIKPTLLDGDSMENFQDCDYISEECPLCNRKKVLTHETADRIKCMECGKSVEKQKKVALAA